MFNRNLLIILVVAFSYGQGLLAHQDSLHDSHDWRTDSDAFKSVQLDTQVYPKLSKALLDRTAIEISDVDFKLKLEELTGARDITVNGNITRIKERGSAEGRNLARQWLEQEYRALGFKVSQQAYAKGANLIAEKNGSSGKVLILSSHMDSVSNAGANDDAAGTVANLLIAKSLMGVPLQHTLRIIAFDSEELGLVGSRAYVKSLNSNEIIGNIQMEMMSYNSKKDGKFHLIDCDRQESTFLTSSIMSVIQSLGMPLTRVKACTNRSDHGSFWEAKIPAVVVSENFFGGDGDICYHDKCDIVDQRLDLKYAALIAKAVGHGVADLLATFKSTDYK